MVDGNKAQVLTDQQVQQVAKRLFRAIDQEEHKTLNKEEATEFFSFLKEHLFHSQYNEARDKAKIENMFDTLPFKEREYEVPNPERPEYPIKKKENRVAFKPLFDALYAEARADGCIWIPFEETSPKKKQSYADMMEGGGDERQVTATQAAAAQAHANLNQRSEPQIRVEESQQ